MRILNNTGGYPERGKWLSTGSLAKGTRETLVAFAARATPPSAARFRHVRKFSLRRNVVSHNRSASSLLDLDLDLLGRSDPIGPEPLARLNFTRVNSPRAFSSAAPNRGVWIFGILAFSGGIFGIPPEMDG